MGLVGVEPTASPLSGVRSNQLSYRPNNLIIFHNILNRQAAAVTFWLF